MRFKAIGLIQDEHRSLAAVIQAPEFLVRKYNRENKAPAPLGLGDPNGG